MSGVRTRSRRSVRRDDGASAVEFAIVLPVLLLLLVGLIEFAFVMRDWMSVSTSVRVAARTASQSAGNGCIYTVGGVCAVPSLAQGAADAVERAGLGMPKGSIDYILVYQANSKGYPCTSAACTDTNTTMPTMAQCGTSSYPNCVAFNWDTSANGGVGGFVASLGTGSGWDSTRIDACLPSPDQVGVYMKVNHPYMTKMFGATIGLSDRAVMRFEPLPGGECAGDGTSHA